MHLLLRVKLHPELQRLLVRPADRRMRAKPSRSGPMTTLAAHAVADVKRLRAFRWRRVNCVASQAFWRTIRRGQAQNLGHTHGDRSAQHRIGARMFVFRHPGAVFVLPDSRLRHRTNAAVARGRTASPRANVLHRRRGLCCSFGGLALGKASPGG